MPDKAVPKRARILINLLITSAVVLLTIGLLLFLATHYMHVSIENSDRDKVVISNVTFGGLPIKITDVALEAKERVDMSALKFFESPVLNVRLLHKEIERNASCVLDTAGSDSCNVYVLNDGTLDCTCYK